MAHVIKDKDGNPVKRNDEEVLAADFMSTVKEVNPEKRTLSIIGTDETKDRDGDIIRVRGWEMENFLKNPVFLWAHNYSSVPLAAARKVARKRIPHPHILFTEQFPEEGVNPFADMILNLYKAGVINASSVGFIPQKWNKIEPDENDERDYFMPREFVKQELLELSGCAVPSNPSALQLAMKGFSIPEGVSADKAVEYLLGTAMPEFKNQDDILGEIDQVSQSCEFVDETEARVHQVPDNVEGKETHTQGAELELTDIEQLTEEGAEEIDKDAAEKPYKNEHACRVKSPSEFDRFARKNCKEKVDGKCLDVIFGIKGEKAEVQAYRYKKDTWTVRAAKAHCKGKGTFHPAAESFIELEALDCEDGLCLVGDEFVIRVDELDGVQEQVAVGFQKEVEDKVHAAFALLREVVKALDGEEPDDEKIFEHLAQSASGGSAASAQSRSKTTGNSLYETILGDDSPEGDLKGKPAGQAAETPPATGLSAERSAALREVNRSLRTIADTLRTINEK